MGPSGTELHDRSALGGTDDAAGFGGDEGLVVHAQQEEGLEDLGFHRSGPDGDEGLVGEDDRPLRSGPHVPGEAEIPQALQPGLREAALAFQVFDIALIEPEVAYVVDDLLQSAGDAEAAFVRHRAVEEIEVDDPVSDAGFQEAVGHGVLIEVVQKGVFVVVHALSPLCEIKRSGPRAARIGVCLYGSPAAPLIIADSVFDLNLAYSWLALEALMAAMASLRERSMPLSLILMTLTGMMSPTLTTSSVLATLWSSSLLIWTSPSFPGAISTLAPMGRILVTFP